MIKSEKQSSCLIVTCSPNSSYVDLAGGPAVFHAVHAAHATSSGMLVTNASGHQTHPLPLLQQGQGKAVAATCTAPPQDFEGSPPK